MVVEQFPDWTIKPSSAIDGRPALVCVVAVGVARVRHVAPHVPLRHVFRACEQPIVLRTVKIDTLLQGNFAKLRHESNTELSMLLIAATFLPLTQATWISHINRIFYAAGPEVASKIRQSFIKDVAIVEKYADCDARANVAD